MSNSNKFTKWLCESEGSEVSVKPKKGGIRKMITLAQSFLANGNTEAAMMTLEQLAQDPLMEAMDPAQVFAKLSSLIKQSQAVVGEIREFHEVGQHLEAAHQSLTIAGETLGLKAVKPSAPAEEPLSESRWRR
jgi:hypothetical protein